MRGRRGFLGLLAGGALALLAGRWIAGQYADWALHDALGFGDLWRVKTTTLALLRSGTFAAVAAFAIANLLALRASIVSLVLPSQIGGLEIHLWGATAKSLERPDRLVIDLDPDPSVGFAAVRDAARDVRDVLKTAGLVSFPMVTGGKGIHVVAPLNATQDWDTVKGFARGVATKLAENEPERFVATMAKVKRKGRIFIDWLRNERGATAVAPYSTRAREGAPVAAPITWDELEGGAHPRDFDLRSMMNRLDSLKADPWADFLTTRQSITQAVWKKIAA